MSEFSDAFELGRITVAPKTDQLSYQEQTLEIQSMAMKVLCFFASHSDELISRDCLREQVWQNATASDHTINNHIYSLRQALRKLDPETKYIHTVTGSKGNGYRLLAEVKVASTQTLAVAPQVIQPKSNNKAPFVAAVAMVLLTLAMVMVYYLINPLRYDQSSPLTTQIGREQSPAISHDGAFMLYSHRPNRDSSWELYASTMAQPQQAIKVFDGSDHDDNFVSISPNNRRIAFNRLVKGQEGIYIADFDADTLTASDAKRIIPLSRDNLSPAISWWGADRLFYTAKGAARAPLRIYLYDLVSANIEQVTAPALKTGGDYAIMLAPDQSQLAVMRSEGVMGFRLYLYDLASKSLTKTPVHSKELRLNISWRDDSQGVYFIDQQGVLSVYDINQQHPEQKVVQISRQQYLGYWPLKIPGREQFVMQQDWGLSSLTTQIIRYNNPVRGGDGQSQVLVNNGLSIRSIESVEQGGLVFASIKANFQVELWRYKADQQQASKLGAFNEKPQYRYPLSLSTLKGSDKALLSINDSCRLVDINSGKDTPLCPTEQQIYAGTFANDGQSVFLADAKKEPVSWQMGISGYPFNQLSQLPNANLIKQHPRGDFYYRREPGFDIYHHDSQAGTNHKIIARHYLNHNYSTNDFVVTARGIYYMDKRQGKKNAVYYYDFASKTQRHVIDSPNEYPNIALSDDEQFIDQIQSIDNDSQLRLISLSR